MPTKKLDTFTTPQETPEVPQVLEKIDDLDGPVTPYMNTYKREILDQLAKELALQNKIIKERGTEELFIFNRFVLEVEKGKDMLGSFHQELCNFVEEDRHKKKLLLLPRGHLKSTLVTIGYATQQIVKNPNIRILILNATWQLAVDFLSEIKRNLQQSPKLLELYGDLTVNNTEWSQDRITLFRPDGNIKGPTVWAAGIDGNLTGSHPDLIIMDDVVTRDNTQSIEQIDKVKLRYKDALDLLEPKGQLIVIGTRWTHTDFYSWIMDRDNNIRQNYQIMIKKAYEGNIETGEGFKALWPEKFDRKELLSRKQEKGNYEFSAQYQNNPVDDADADFKRAWFQYYQIEDYRGAAMRTYLTVDPAISMKKEADYTAMGVYSIDQFSNIFVKDLVRGHWKPSTIIDAIFYLAELWHPNGIVLETIAYQQALAYALIDEMRKRGRKLPIIEKKYFEKSKVERIRGLQPLYENKKVYHRKELKLTPYFEEELLQFPRGGHDDLIDTFSMALDFLTPPPQNREKRYQHRYLY